MEFTDIKLLDNDVNLSKIKPLDWDLEINGIPYYVCRIEGYCHSISWQGGNETRHELWCYPRHEQPSLENLVEYTLKSPVAWGIEYDEVHKISHKWDEAEIRSGARTVITRNGKPFYTVGGGRDYSIPKAITLIAKINEHPLDFNVIEYYNKMIGRKVWYNGQPSIITHYVQGQCCVIIEPDGIEKFECPPEFKTDDCYWDYEDEHSLKIDCLESNRVWWFRDN